MGEPTTETVIVHRNGPVFVVTINRQAARNAVDRPTAAALVAAFEEFEADADLATAVLTGANGQFCAGADLKAIGTSRSTKVSLDPAHSGPMGPTRMVLSKPVIAAVEGHAVAGGLELALWCDLRVAASDARFGVYCRRWGVPLIDGGTIRLPRLIGQSRALDLILTGRPVDADEAERIGLVNRVCEPGQALATAVQLGRNLAAFPQTCLRADLASARSQWGLDIRDALMAEVAGGVDVLSSADTVDGVSRFVGGEGRHGAFG